MKDTDWRMDCGNTDQTHLSIDSRSPVEQEERKIRQLKIVFKPIIIFPVRQQDQRLSVLYSAVDSLKERRNEWAEEERDFQVRQDSLSSAAAGSAQ